MDKPCLDRNIKYKITVKTGSSLGAGTDSDIFIEINGVKGNTQRIPLNKSVSLDKESDIFENGKTDIFEVESADVGKVYLTVKFVFESHKNLIIIINITDLIKQDHIFLIIKIIMQI